MRKSINILATAYDSNTIYEELLSELQHFFLHINVMRYLNDNYVIAYKKSITYVSSLFHAERCSFSSFSFDHIIYS